MAYQVQSNIDPLLSNLVASEEGIAQRGMQGLAQQQSMALAQQQMGQQERLAQMGMFQSQAEMQQRMALEQQRQQFEQGQQTSRQQFELQQNQMLMAAQQKAARDAQSAALELKKLDIDFQIAKAEGRQAAAQQLQQQMSQLKKVQADAAFQQSILGRRMEMTPEKFDALADQIGSKATQLGEQMKTAADNAGRFSETAQMNLSSAEIRKAVEAVQLLGAKMSAEEIKTALNFGGLGVIAQKLLSQGIDLTERELSGLAYVALQPSMGIAERAIPGVERSAGLVQRVDTDEEIRKKVQATAVDSMIATLSTIPGQKQFNADAARTALEALLAGGGQGDATQQLVAAGMDPTTVKIMFQNLAAKANENALNYDNASAALVARGGERSLRSMAIEAAARAERQKMSMFANAAGSMVVTDLEDLRLMSETVRRIRMSGEYGKLAEGAMLERAQRYGLGEDVNALLDYLSEGRMGPGIPIRSARELENEFLAGLNREAQLGGQLSDLVAGAEMQDVGGELEALRRLSSGVGGEIQRLRP